MRAVSTMRPVLLVALVLVGFAARVAAQPMSESRTRPLQLNTAILSTVDVSMTERRPIVAPDEVRTTPSVSWQFIDERSLQTLLRGLSANRAMRTADAAAGMALVTLAARGDVNLPPAAIFVGVHALRLGLESTMPPRLRAYSVEPHIERGGFSISVTRKY
jgi:hypothetical protein